MLNASKRISFMVSPICECHETEILSGSSAERVSPAIEPVYREEFSTVGGPMPSALNVTLDANSANRAFSRREEPTFQRPASELGGKEHARHSARGKCPPVQRPKTPLTAQLLSCASEPNTPAEICDIRLAFAPPVVEAFAAHRNGRCPRLLRIGGPIRRSRDAEFWKRNSREKPKGWNWF
jgi:hypothetical protein